MIKKRLKRISIISNLLIVRSKTRWRRLNKHNHTILEGNVLPHRVKVGKGTYGVINVAFSGQERKLYIGNYCSIGSEVLFVPEADHKTDYVSTYPWSAYFDNCIDTGGGGYQHPKAILWLMMMCG